MSFTETQVIHRPITQTGTSTFLLTNGIEPENKGQKMGMEPINCGLSSASLSGWILRALSYFQKAHLDLDSFADKMSETIQKKAIHILPLFLYLSLLVLGVQGVVIMVLLTQSLLPLGMWFLMTCITTMGGVFCFTAVLTEHPTKRKNQ